MNDNFLSTSSMDTARASGSVDRMQQLISMQRKAFERRWYDNNFFDDGHHFRYVSRITGKIIDINDKVGLYDPKRAIPKASRQIRGVANLLVQNDYIPIIYPDKVDPTLYPNGIQNPNYQEKQKIVMDHAKKISNWVQKVWKDQDLFNDQLAQMVILAAKNSISYMQIWWDSEKEKICTKVYDAFDIYVQGQLTSIYDSPILVKCVPSFISDIQSNELFDANQRTKLNADNKYASSEIKEAYMRARFGFNSASVESNATILLKEAYVKEKLDEYNIEKIQQQEDADLILSGKKMGDTVIRQIFSAGGVWLKDTYTSLPEYPFVDFRMEPGPLYQTSLIERFIPSNKTLDNLMSRLEKYSNTMVTGIWTKRKGENFEITNVAGGQVINYEATPPTQAAINPIPSFYFETINLLNSFIEEQGVSTSALGKIPSGVKAASAIESLKEGEYSNLKIAFNQIKKTIKGITIRMLDIADKYFVTPQEVQIMEGDEPMSFQVIGNRGVGINQQIGNDVSQAVTIKNDYDVDIEIESGSAYTFEGKKELIGAFMDRMVQLQQAGLVNPEVNKLLIKKFIEIYQFGSSADFAEALNAPTQDVTETDVQKIKIAMAEVIKDLDLAGDKASETRIMENKIGMAEALKDTGLLDKKETVEKKEPSKSISFKDLPPEGQSQLAAQAGIQIDTNTIKQDQNNKLIKENKNAIK